MSEPAEDLDRLDRVLAELQAIREDRARIISELEELRAVTRELMRRRAKRVPDTRGASELSHERRSRVYERALLAKRKRRGAK